VEDVGLDAPNVRRRRGRAVKTFSQWIQNEPKEKWSLLFDKGCMRHGIMTTNFAEVYNAILRGTRAQPLVGLIKFFLYPIMKYFLGRANAAHAGPSEGVFNMDDWVLEQKTEGCSLLQSLPRTSTS
jgi:hypothetical protein